MPRQPRRKAPGVATALVVWAVVEAFLLAGAVHLVGAWPLVLVLCVKFVAGAAILRHEGRRAWREWWDRVGQGELPVGRVGDAAQTLLAGVLLMLPGLLCSVVGLVLLIPATRPLVRRATSRLVSGLGVVTLAGGQPWGADPDVIRGEVVDDPADRTGDASPATPRNPDNREPRQLPPPGGEKP